MARYAVVQGGVVVNVIEADADFAATVGGIASETASPGDLYSGGVFTRPDPPPASVPASVSMAQARIALARAGVSESTVDSLIEALPDGLTKTEARIWWQRSNEVQRAHPVVALMAPALGLDTEELDNLFREAATV